MQALHGHLTPEFLAMMSGLVHAMRQDPALAEVLWTHLVDDSRAARLIVDRAVGRGELPGGAEARLAGLMHEVIEGQVFRQMVTGAPIDAAFAAHVVDDLVVPVLTGRPQAAT